MDILELIEQANNEATFSVIKEKILGQINANNVKQFCEGRVVLHVKELYDQSNSTERLRIFELLLATGSFDIYDAYHDIMENELRAFAKADYLVLASLLDIFAHMCKNDAVFGYIKEKQLISAVRMIIDKADDNVIILPNVATFIAKLAHHNPKCMFTDEDQYQLIDFILQPFKASELVEEYYITALGIVGSTSEGVLHLHSLNIWDNIVRCFKNSISDRKVAFLRAFAAIFSTGLDILESFYTSLGSIKYIHELTSATDSSLEQMSLAGFSALRGLSCTKFGVEEMLKDYVWMTNFLLNREKITEYHVKVAKYDLAVDILRKSEEFEIGNSEKTALREFVDQGAFYSKMTANVDFEAI